MATSRALLGQNDSVVNGLVSPTGTVGMVKISTGPLSSAAPDGIVPVETAIALLKDFGGSSIKYFPMGGLKCRDEYKAVAEACARHDFWLEPTGGIDLENYEAILQIALDAGVSKIIPHIYSSIIDKASGDTRPEDVRTLLAMTKKLRSRTHTYTGATMHTRTLLVASLSMFATVAVAQTQYARWVPIIQTVKGCTVLLLTRKPAH